LLLCLPRTLAAKGYTMTSIINTVFARNVIDSHPPRKLAVAAGCSNWHLEHPVWLLKTSAAKAKRISGFEFCKRLNKLNLLEPDMLMSYILAHMSYNISILQL
jgi:hypothetical protein